MKSVGEVMSIGRTFEEVFQKVDTDNLYRFKKIVRNVFGIFGRSRDRYFEEDDEDPILLEILKRNQDSPFDNLFHEYNKRNLISKTKLKEIYDERS